MNVKFIKGDVFEKVKEIPEASFDAILTDPPYGLGHVKDMNNVLAAWLSGEEATANESDFMGKGWTLPSPNVWREVLRVLKPGALGFVFAGTRTQDLVGLSLRLAGFEVRDTLMWVYGSGRPSGLDIGKKLEGWEGYHTTLKPGYEPILVVRKPSRGGLLENLQTHQCGALNTSARGAGGRFPANLVLSEGTAEELDEQTGVLKSGREPEGGLVRRADRARHAYGTFAGQHVQGVTYGDEGGGSRFFYCAKVSPAERQKGGVLKSKNPCLKPIDLTKHLASLLGLPQRKEARRLLVSYSGEGSEVIGAGLSGHWDEIVGIEKDASYVQRAEERVSSWLKGATQENIS